MSLFLILISTWTWTYGLYDGDYAGGRTDSSSDQNRHPPNSCIS